MVRLFNAYFPVRTLLLALSDVLVIILGLLVASEAGWWAFMQPGLTFRNTLLSISMVSLVCVLCMHCYDLYESQMLADLRELATRLTQVLGTCCLILALTDFVYPDFQFRRGVFAAGIIFIGVLLAGWRKLFFLLTRVLGLTQRVLLLSCGPLAIPLTQEIALRPELGVQVLGYVGEPPRNPGVRNGMRWFGGLCDLPDVVEREDIDRLIVTMRDRRGQLPLNMLLQLKSRGLRVEDGADVYERITGKIHLDSLRLSWFVFPPGFSISRAKLIYKRVFSVVVSLIALFLSLPVMVLVALAIRLDTPGPALFRQKRIGKGGRVFVLYKFRSMRINADSDGIPRPVRDEHDPRLTRVGRWLRRTRLDELPQLYNILRGDMYFVGPRPFVPEQEEELVKSIPFYRCRWAVKPGATGWAQIRRAYCATVEDNAEKLAYDLFYIKNGSVGLDLLILFQTAKILLLGRGAR